MNEIRIGNLKNTSLQARKHVINLATDGGCFLGASLSCIDLIVFLYLKYLNIRKQNLDDPNRDYFFLSKGHSVPALYATFAEIGFLQPERLKNHLKIHDTIYWHPNRNIPGVEFHSGSLGHSLPLAVGVALDCKIKNQRNKVIVLTGDGELNEGSNWEACLVAQAYKLDNLIIIIDRNRFQANMKTEDLIPSEPLEMKFKSFGCAVNRIDGHNFEVMDSVFSQIPFETNKPNVIIANTVRGKGLQSIEARADQWFCNFTREEVDTLLKELDNHYNQE